MVTKPSNKINFLNATKLALVSALFFSSNAGAAVILEHGGTVEVGTDYHSNIQFLDDKIEESVYIYSIVPEYKVSALDGKNKWFGSLGIRLEKSSNQTIRDDRDDPFGKIGWQRELENGKLELAADYVKQSSRQTQFGQTGVLAVDGSTVAKSASAVWLHGITPKLDLTTNAEYQDTAFSGVSELSDFNTKNLGFELMYKFNERVKPYVGVVATDYKANGLLGNSRIKYQTYTAGADVTLNPKFSFNASAGMVQFNSSSQDELVGGVTASYLGNRYQVQGTLARTVFPTGLNNIEVGDQLRVDYSYSLTEVSRFGVGTAATQNKSGIDTQDITGFYDYDLSRSWLMHVEVGQRYLKTAGVESADDTQLGVFFTYTGPKF